MIAILKDTWDKLKIETSGSALFYLKNTEAKGRKARGLFHVQKPLLEHAQEEVEILLDFISSTPLVLYFEVSKFVGEENGGRK